jgi:signal transduction histidine kinase
MRERVAELKGHLDISSPAGGGTRIRARLPLLATPATTETSPESVES